MIRKDMLVQKNERLIFDLRAMYARYGYVQFHIRKFEEYDLYVKNKDFLNSVNIITFTDTNGKLMALKPDVTLSIVKNSRDVSGLVQKVYYNENIYRVSHRSHMFEELTQVGIECIGDTDDYNIFEVLMLAAKSLKLIGEDTILVVSDLDIVSAIMDHFRIPDDIREDLIQCLGEKNIHTLRKICRQSDVEEDFEELMVKLVRIYGRPCDALKAVREMSREAEREKSAEESSGSLYEKVSRVCDRLTMLFDMFDDDIRDMVRIDFSVVSDVNYYNGIVFNGFVEGLPECVISGGQYDRLMKKMKRHSRAIGFGIYMDRLERFLSGKRDRDIDILLLYEPETDVSVLKKTIEELIEKGNTVLAQKSIPERMEWGKILRLKDGEVEEVETDS